MTKMVIRWFCCLLVATTLLPLAGLPAMAGEREERIQLLQDKMDKLKELLSRMEEEKLREQPPTESPWQPILQLGEERRAYAQYAYLLAPQMLRDDLDSVLQQLHFVAGQDDLTERGTLIVLPALPFAAGEPLTVDRYNREFARDLLNKVGLPAALEGGLLVSSDSLGQERAVEEPLLFIDLSGCDQILRARILDLLMSQRLFTAAGSIPLYLWDLLQAAAPRAFSVHMQGKVLWLGLEK